MAWRADGHRRHIRLYRRDNPTDIRHIGRSDHRLAVGVEGDDIIAQGFGMSGFHSGPAIIVLNIRGAKRALNLIGEGVIALIERDRTQQLEILLHGFFQ